MLLTPPPLGRAARTPHAATRAIACLMLLLALLLGLQPVVLAQSHTASGSTASTGTGEGTSLVTAVCTPPPVCFASVQARQDWARAHHCQFLEDVCTQAPSAQDGDKGVWARLLELPTYGYEFVKGLLAGLQQQLGDLLELIGNPLDAVEGLIELGKAFYADPEGTLRTLAALLGQEALDTITRATQCGAYDLGRIIGQHVSPAVALKLAGKLSKYKGHLGDAVQETRHELGCASFAAGTLVHTPQGLQAIERISAGARVHSRAAHHWSEAPQTVLNTFSRTAPDHRVLRTEHGSVRLTAEHPLWVQGKGWTPAAEVTDGDVLAALVGDTLVRENRAVPEPLAVHNFSVAHTPSYFVGEAGLWVHNANCNIVPGGGLGAHEGRGKGHTLEKHVNVTTDDLRDRANGRGRYAGQRPPSMSSRYNDRATAEFVIGRVIDDNRGAVDDWLKNSSFNNDLTIEPQSEFPFPIGVGIPKEGSAAQKLSSAIVVLRKNSDDPGEYFILTSYPRPTP